MQWQAATELQLLPEVHPHANARGTCVKVERNRALGKVEERKRERCGYERQHCTIERHRCHRRRRRRRI
eukprot:6428712-Prymnesium_polylepis.1